MTICFRRSSRPRSNARVALTSPRRFTRATATGSARSIPISARFSILPVTKQFADGEAVRWWCATVPARSGRIAAFYNRRRPHSKSSPRGCGIFESIDDQQVADLMFDASRMWLASRGMEAMDGPINFGQRDAWWGLLVEGYEFQPLYGEPLQPALLQGAVRELRIPELLQPEHLHLENLRRRRERHGPRPGKRLFSTPGYGFRQIDMSRIEEEAENFRIIYNKAWSLFRA